MGLAVAQQFHDRARRSPAGDDRVTRWLNAGNVEDGHGLIGVQQRGDTASAAAAAFALACAVASAAEPSSRAPDAGGATAGTAVAALVSTDGSRCTCVMPKTRAARQAAASAKNGTTVRAIDAAVMMGDRWPDRWLVSAPGLTLRPFVPVIKSALTGIPVLLLKNRVMAFASKIVLAGLGSAKNQAF